MLGNCLRELGVEKEDKFLDYGCGFCRLFPIYKKIVDSKNYVGVDISRAALELAGKRHESELFYRCKKAAGIA